jgi:hypothetical protein
MISQILQTLFFAIDNVFGELFWIFNAGLVVAGIVLAIIYHMTKR